jgi:glycolate oxidase
VPIHGGVSLSLERMNQVLEVNVADSLIVAQAGVLTAQIDALAAQHGLFYPPDPNSAEYCTIGGNVAENAGGPRALKYGVTRDYVLGLQWVLPTGKIIRVGRRTTKGVAGYDLVGLFVGSEGTLGVATEVTLKLIPRPRVVRTALLSFSELKRAANAVTQILTHGIWPRTLELLDDVALSAVGGRGLPFVEGAKAVLIVEVDGNDDQAVFNELGRFVELCHSLTPYDAVVAQDESQRERIWSIRREVSRALRTLWGKKVSEDIVVPRSRIPEAIERFKEAGQRQGLVVATYGHAGDGNLHTNVLFRSESDRPRVEQVLSELMAITIELQGTVTGEHGIGLTKKRFLELELTEEVSELQKKLRVAIDPYVILNPGKIWD